MTLLTLNAGSSSLKFAVYERDGVTRRLKGHVDGVGRASARLSLKRPDGLEDTRNLDAPTHADALAAALALAGDAAGAVEAVGHRIVHGGARHDRPVRIDDAVEAELASLIPLAPLHQPHNLAAVAAARAAWPAAVQVACFDTAFHRGHAFSAEAFALPRRYYDEGVRRYGFHGLSYAWLTEALAAAEGRTPRRAVLCHLGSGASLCAVLDGVSCDTSMGFSALDGLPMATRCGQIDPGVLLYLIAREGLGATELSDLLYKRSGLAGLSGTGGDMREIEAAGTREAADALAYFAYRCRREIAAMCASLGGLDALVFSAGVGEHAPGARASICAGLDWLGVRLDPDRNAAAIGHAARISPDDAPVSVWVLPTDEEAMIARAAAEALQA